MSAYLCDPQHLSALVNGCPKRGGFHDEWLHDGIETPEQRFADLLAENLASLAGRYPDTASPFGPALITEWTSAPEAFVYDPRAKYGSAVEYYKGLQCYSYQSCEHEGWKESKAHAWVKHRMSEAISAMPGYDDAAWGYKSEAEKRAEYNAKRVTLHA